MRIFITGATGFVGSGVVRDLLGAGHRVVGLARSDEAASVLAVAGVEAHRGDLADPESLRRGAEQADAVLHVAFDHDFARLAESCATDVRAIEALGDALRSSDRPLIVTSGLPVTPGRRASEEDVAPPGGHGIPRRSEQTAMSLVERGVRCLVVRMPQVHDREKQGFGSYLLAHAREKGVSAYVGEGTNRWPAVHRLDAARLYGLALAKGTAGDRFHAVAEEGVPVRVIAEAIGERLGVPVVAMTPEQSASHFGWLDRIARMDVPASSGWTQERLGWRPTERSTLLDDITGALPTRA